MCPRCKLDKLTRFGPYPPDATLRWLFSCQTIDKGCGWWTESGNPFRYQFMRAIGLEQVKPKSAEKGKTLEQIHAEWRHAAGLDHLPFSEALQKEEEKLLTEAVQS